MVDIILIMLLLEEQIIFHKNNININTVLPSSIRKMLKDINLDFGVPVNIYDRIYFDDYYGIKGGDRGGYYLPEIIITDERKKT